MEIKLKQRVIGAIVLGALIVIFIPLLFKGSETTPRQVVITEQIPPPPPLPTAQAITTAQTNMLGEQKSNQVYSHTANGTSTNEQSSFVTSPANNQTVTTQIQQTQNNLNSNIQPATSNLQTATQDQTIGSNSQNLTGVSSDNHNMPNQSPINNATAIRSNPGLTPQEMLRQSRVTDIQTQAIIQPPIASQQTSISDNTNTAAQLQTASSITSVSEEKKRVIKVPVVTKPTAPKVNAWVVQLGSFSDVSNAKSLEKQLRAQGFKAYTQKIKTNHRTMTRVLLGPEVKRTKAEALQNKLDKEFHLSGVVVAFDPLQVR